jgi:hypothetical protein
VERLLGPAKAVREVLDSLDRQYRAQRKPAVWFLPLNEPIAPHLDQVLGPAKSVKEVLDGLDRQYRTQGKPAVLITGQQVPTRSPRVRASSTRPATPWRRLMKSPMNPVSRR